MKIIELYIRVTIAKFWLY